MATLVNALQNDPSPEVRAEAALALRAAPEPHESIVRTLLGALEDEHELPRRAAVVSLRAYMNEAIARRLVALLRERPELWRETAAALGGGGAGLVTEDLEAILQGATHVRSRKGAARALGPQPMRAAEPEGAPGRVHADKGGFHAL